MEGIVTKSTGSWYEVLINDSEIISARLKGLLRLEESADTNPVAVGDKVMLVKEDNDWMIEDVKQRKNFIVRASPKHKGARQIIAANIDQCFLVCTHSHPRTSSGFIDRFLLTAEAYHIPVTILFNKQDLLDEKAKKKQEYLQNIYAKIGYEIMLISALNQENLRGLIEKLQAKTSLFAGHSGVGKSTLLNALCPDLNLKTLAVSRMTGKGMHTTTFAEMHRMDSCTKIIDTPGIREFGIVHFQPEEISHYFVEMRPFLPSCKFNNCMHLNEPECGVKEAYLKGGISEERYTNYLNILSDYQANFKHWEN